MENQHKKIKGYRDLSANEIDLMNRIKDKAEDLGLLIKTLKEMRLDERVGFKTATELLESDESLRCLDLAKNNLQQGVMWAVRAIALPQSF